MKEYPPCPLVGSPSPSRNSLDLSRAKLLESDQGVRESLSVISLAMVKFLISSGLSFWNLARTFLSFSVVLSSLSPISLDRW